MRYLDCGCILAVSWCSLSSVTVISGTVGSAAVRVKFLSLMFLQLSITKAVISPCVTSLAPRPSMVRFLSPFIHRPICLVASGFSCSEVVFDTW